MTSYNDAVNACTTIEELCATLNELNQKPDWDPDRNPDITSLPLYSDLDHTAPLGVFSWSKEKYLWCDGPQWFLTDREETP